MKRIFLSLGFRGRSEEEVRLEIERAKYIIATVYCPNEEIEFVHNFDYMSDNRVECLGEAIKKLSTCHIAYFINKWENHKGCIIEKHVCDLYNIPYNKIMVI